MAHQSLKVELGARSYPIEIGAGVLAQLPQHLGQQACLLLTDSNVADHYLAAVRSALALSEAQIMVVAAGESSKRFEVLNRVLDWMLAQRLPRDGVLIALGGGVIGDLGGFAAAIYQRGIDFIQLPTSLLAQVDSSVGGKTGINHAAGKNMIGAFHQPIAVLADTDTLQTLPPRELRAGLAEVIKYALLGDADFLQWLEANMSQLLALDTSALAHAIHHCCAMKARIVAADEREAGQRALLNLGHTFGHAIEAHAGYGAVLHGEAVAIGMLMAARMSAALGWISSEELQRVARLLQQAELPTAVPAGMSADDFLVLMASDKKVAAGRLRLVLLKSLGQAVLCADYPDAALRQTLADCCSTEALT